MTYAPLAAGCPPGFTLISEEFEGLASSYCSLPFLPDMEFDLWCGNLQRTIQHQVGGRAGGREGGREGERKRVGGHQTVCFADEKADMPLMIVYLKKNDRKLDALEFEWCNYTEI